MTDFKAGDVVTFCMSWDAWQGGKGIVLGASEWGKGHYNVEVTEVPKANGSVKVGHTTDFKAEWLELVKPEPKFNICDYVTVTGKDLSRAGKQGTVRSLNGPYQDWPVVVEFPDGVRYNYGTDELVKATSYFLGFAPGGATKLYDYAAADVRLTAKVLGQFEGKPAPLKIYLAGPMSGIEHYNFPAFFTAARKLRAAGHTVFNPAENDLATGFNALGMEGHEAADHGFSLREALKTDLAWICENADALVLLEGWEVSKGVRAEMSLAEALGLPKYEMNKLPSKVAK